MFAVAVGVGHVPRLAIVARLGDPAVLYVDPSGRWPLFRVPYGCAVGVGSHNPNSFSQVWRSNV